jgi:DNA-binding XRE family transcriptional regulator
MIQFELAEPTTLANAVRLPDPGDGTIRPIAGGTALMLMMKAGVFCPAKLVSLRKIESNYTAITADARGLTIGAMTTRSDLEQMTPKGPDSIDRIVGRNIRIYRLQKGLTQTELADELGLTFQQIQKYEKGTNRVWQREIAEDRNVSGCSGYGPIQG